MTHQGFMKLSGISSSFNFPQQLCCPLLHILRTNTGKERRRNQYLGIQASRPYGNVQRVDSAHVLESFWGRHCFSPIVKRKLLVMTHFRTSKHGLSEPSLFSITFSNWKTVSIPHSLTKELISGNTYFKTTVLDRLRREDTL